MKKMMGFVVAVMMMVLAVSMSVVASNEKDVAIVISNEEYKEMEQECLQEVKMILLEKGCKDAGVTLTYVTMEDGSREYTVNIHHGKLDTMETEEYSLLQERIKEMVRETMLSQANIKRI